MRRKRTALETATAVEHAERQRRALGLRLGGASYDRIATACGYANRGGAYKAVTSAIADITREPAEALRTLELERLDALYAKAASIVASPLRPTVVLDAIRTATRLLERRAKMLGLDAATKVDAMLAAAPDTRTPAELEARRIELIKQLAADCPERSE